LFGADVRPGEGAIVFVFFLNLMLMMTAFYILKVISEPLILAEGGALTRSFARGIEAAIVIGLLPGYVLLAQRFDPSRLVVWLDLAFAISLIGLAILASIDARIGLVFFVWLGIFGTLAIAQFWSLANDLFSQSQGLRLFPAVAVGGTLGGIAGAQLAAHGIKWLEPYELMLAADVLIAACVVLTAISRHHARRVRRSAAKPAAPPAEATLAPRAGAWSRMLSDPYLLLIAASVLLLNAVNTTGEYILADLVSRRADEIARHASDGLKARDMYIASFYGNFRTIVSVVATALQLVLVARVLKRSGLQQALMLLPLLAIASYGAAAVAPLLGTIVAVKVAENGADYSLSNTVRQALFLPTTRKAKYQAKTAIDMSLVRVGDLASASLVALGASLSLGIAELALANMAIAMVWLVVNFKLAGRYRGVARARGAA
jgi:AAA family ATP:ADP antiporter